MQKTMIINGYGLAAEPRCRPTFKVRVEDVAEQAALGLKGETIVPQLQPLLSAHVVTIQEEEERVKMGE